MTDLPSGWTEVALGEIATFIRGVTFKPTDLISRGAPDGVDCLRTKNVQEVLDLTDVWAVPTSVVKREEQYLSGGDVLISSANSWNLLGKCAWVPEGLPPTTFGGFVTALRAKKQVDQRFLYRWFSSGVTQHRLRGFGRQTTNISNLDLHRCREMPVPLPPIEEQRRIAAILDKADELRAKRRAALAKLDTVTQAIFVNMFSGDRRGRLQSLGDLASVITKGTTPTSIGYAFADSGIGFVRAQDLGPPKLDLDSLQLYIDSWTDEALARSRLRPSDVLISIAGTIGRCSIVPLVAGPLNCNQAVALVRGLTGLVPEYLLAWLRTSDAQRQMAGSQVTGTISNLSLGRIKSLQVPVPTLDRQIAFFLTSEHVAIDAQRQSSATQWLGDLCASLQSRAFRGEL